MTRIIAVVLLCLVIGRSIAAAETAPDCDAHEVKQTSASMIYEYARCLERQGRTDFTHMTHKNLLITDIYIKAWTYSWINKVAFWTSIGFALAILLWPAINIVFKDAIERKSHLEWLRSPTIQTTIAAVAALSFALYAEYKDKQTNAETLMRRTLYSNEAPEDLVKTVADELARIDRGFSFTAVFDKAETKNGGGGSE